MNLVNRKKTIFARPSFYIHFFQSFIKTQEIVRPLLGAVEVGTKSMKIPSFHICVVHNVYVLLECFSCCFFCTSGVLFPESIKLPNAKFWERLLGFLFFQTLYNPLNAGRLRIKVQQYFHDQGVLYMWYTHISILIFEINETHSVKQFHKCKSTDTSISKPLHSPYSPSPPLFFFVQLNLDPD